MSFLKKAQQQVAHTSKLPALGNRDLRSLQDTINTEKSFMQSNSKAATDFKKNAEALKTWAADEGEDLNDIVGKLSVLYDHYQTSQNRLNSHLGTVRLHFKSIRTREESLSELKSRKRSLGSDIEKVEKKLAKMGPENKELMKVTSQLKEMRNEMEGLRVEVMNEEAAIGDFKRRTVKEALGIKSGALLEMAEKLTIVAEVSKLILEEIPLQPTTPGMPRVEYLGYAKTESLLQEATRCIADVGFTPSGLSAGIPRFADMSMADTTANGSRDITNQYQAHEHDPYNEHSAHANGDEVAGDTGYIPAADQVLSHEEMARTPIYAAHASRSQWAQEGAQDMSDPATHEWAQAERGDTSAAAAASAAMAATAGADLNAVPGHGDPHQADGGFMMQTSSSHAGSAAVPLNQQIASNRNSADYQSAQGGHAGENVASAEGHQSDAYDGYAASSGNHHTHNLPAPPATMLGAPTLPPLRTATPLNDLSGGPASAGANLASSNVTSPTTYATTDNAAYFQSIGSTRAMQEAVRRSTSPAPNQNRLSSYGALGAPASQGGSPGVEGKKVTAAAFRKGFNRNPSSQANMTLPPSASGSVYYEDPTMSNPLPAPLSNPHADLTTPVPPGAYNSTTPESETYIQPLHIQKRNSNSHNPLGAAAVAGTPNNLQGRRYSNDLNVSGSEHPAPPYLPDQSQHHHQQQQGYPAQPQVQRQMSSQYAEYAAPPPPGYGYA